MSAQELLRRRWQKDLLDLDETESDYGKQIKKRYDLIDMEGGFGSSEQVKLKSEVGALRKDINEGYQIQEKTLKEIEDQEKERARKEKLGGWLKVSGAVLGAALAIPTGGLSIAGGVALGSTIGEIGNTVYGTGTAPQLNFSFLSDWENYKERKNKVDPEWTEKFENRPKYNLLENE